MRTASALKRIVHEQQGIAMVEFALVLPFMLLLLFGGLEITRYVLVHQKMHKTVASVADLVTQADSISATEVNNIFNAVDHLMYPFEVGADGLVIVTSVGRRDGNAPSINWQRQGGGSLAATSHIGSPGGTPSLPDGFTLRDGEDAIVTEIFFNFGPMLQLGYLEEASLYRRAIFKPRLGKLDELEGG